MTRTIYLRRLGELLAAMPAPDRKEVLADINEHFDSALEQGETEQEVIARLGTPESIAVQYGYTDAVAAPMAGASAAGTPPLSAAAGKGVGAGRIFASIGFGFFNLCIMYPLVFAFLAVVFSLVASAVSIALAGALYLGVLLLSPALSWARDSLIPGFSFVTNLFTGTALASLGGLSSIWAIKLFSLCIRISVHYLVWSFRWIFCMDPQHNPV